MPNIHFGLASRAMLESDEVVAASNVFTVNAVVEGLAGLAAVYESFVPASDRLLVGDGGSDMLLRMWGGAILALAMASFGMRKCDPAPARSAFCVGCALYHAIAASIILHAFFTAEGTALPGAGLVAASSTCPCCCSSGRIAGSSSPCGTRTRRMTMPTRRPWWC